MGMIRDELTFKPRLQVINQDQIEQIHSATLDVLERTGVDIPHEGALEILNDSGAKVAGNRVRMPSWLVEESIRTAPSRIVLGTRTGKRTITLERWTSRRRRRSRYRRTSRGRRCPRTGG